MWQDPPRGCLDESRSLLTLQAHDCLVLSTARYPSFQVWIFSFTFSGYSLALLYHKIITKNIWCQLSS